MSNRGLFNQSLEEGDALPETSRPIRKKREAPGRDRTREEQDELDARHGKPIGFRIHPDTAEAVRVAAAQHGYNVGNFVDFGLRAFLGLLASGRVDLSGREVAGKKKLSLPAIPDDYS